jgi:recombination protein RecA
MSDSRNKVSPPFRQAEFDIYFGNGISREGCLIDMGAQSGILEKSGAWYLYNDEKLGQGRENAMDTLKANTKLADQLEKAIRDQYAATAAAAALSDKTPVADKVEKSAAADKPAKVAAKK